MKSVFTFSILVLALCIGSFAQTNEPAPCPTISLTREPFDPNIGDFVSYTVVLDDNSDKYNVKYEWTVKDGEIVSGQGTSTVKIKINLDSLTVTANVKVSPQNCSSSVTESFIIEQHISILIDEFSTSVSRIDKARFDNLAAGLQNNPNANAYIIENFAKETSRKVIKRKNQLITNYLVNIKGIERDRIVLQNASADKNLTQLFIVPAGAIPPTCDDCITVKSK